MMAARYLLIRFVTSFLNTFSVRRRLSSLPVNGRAPSHGEGERALPGRPLDNPSPPAAELPLHRGA